MIRNRHLVAMPDAGAAVQKQRPTAAAANRQSDSLHDRILQQDLRKLREVRLVNALRTAALRQQAPPGGTAAARLRGGFDA